jgi:ABC-type bacteriocin/lantibiotic exporter with double-glycine peptidase domain
MLKIKKGLKVRQHDFSDCGPACLVSISAFYNLKLPIARIRQYAGTDKRGTNILGLVEAARGIGFNAKGVKISTDTLSDLSLPAIAHVKRANGNTHFIVIYAINIRYVTFMDPADGRFHKISRATFADQWTNIVIILSPSETFEEGNFKHSTIKRFWMLLRPHNGVMIQTLFGSIIYTILGLTFSIYVQKITDFVLIARIPGSNPF